MAKSKSDLATLAWVAQLLAVILVVAALFLARDVFIPLALGLLLSFLLRPLVDRLHVLGIPNLVAVCATAMLAFVLLAGFLTLLGRQVTGLVDELPQYRHELIAKARGFAGLTGGMGESLDQLADDVTEAIEEGDQPIDPTPNSMLQRWTDRLLPSEMTRDARSNDGTTASQAFYVKHVDDALPLATWATTAGTVLGPLATAGLVSVFVLFMLIHREDLRDRIIAVVSHGDYVTTTEAMDEAAHRISRYLVAQTIINTGYGFLLASGLSIIGATMTESGFPNAILWGALATCLRFIPYLGPTAAAVFPSVIALAVFPGYGVFIAVVSLITVMELICNNVIEPWFYGTSTGISAVAVIIAAVFWGWLWGPVGLLLSTPLTVCLVVLGRYVPRFKVFTTLLGENVEIDPSLRFYQRLLANDEHQASEILTRHAQSSDFALTCDEVIVPALKRVRFDHDEERLTNADANRLFALAGGLIADRGCAAVGRNLLAPGSSENDDPGANAQRAIDDALPALIGCTSHHHSEMLILNMLRISGHDRYSIHAIDDDTMPLDTARQVVEANPPVVVIVVLPKGGFAQARYLCKSIRSEGYAGVVIVACFGKFKNFDKLFVKFRKAGTTAMTTSYSQTASKIESILQRSDLPKPPLAVAELVDS